MNSKYQYLIDLYNAIDSIEEDYCNWDYNDTIQKTERVFAYELYFKLKIISILNPNRYENIKFNGEIGKKLQNINLNKLGTNLEFNQVDFNPDLVLHKNQIDYSPENQKLIIEIKTKNQTDENIAKDILKLNYGIENLNFQFGVFISVNTNFETIQNKIRRIFQIDLIDENSRSNLEKIIIINYENQILKSDSLANILK